jgi:hypothetical protein
MTPDQILELTAPSSASVEKQIAADVKMIRYAIDGNRRARNLFFAYAAIAGARANHIMEIAEHGEGEKILAREFPEAHERTILRWRQFAKDLQPALVKSDTVSLLTGPYQGKKSIPSKAAAAIQEAVMETMDGQGMNEFMRSCKALREEKETGGNMGNHHTGPRTPDAETRHKNAKIYLATWVTRILEWARERDNMILAGKLARAEVAEAALELRQAIEKIEAERKAAQ